MQNARPALPDGENDDVFLRTPIAIAHEDKKWMMHTGRETLTVLFFEEFSDSTPTDAARSGEVAFLSAQMLNIALV